MGSLRLTTDRLQLSPLTLEVAAALPEDRDAASRGIGAQVPPEWPHPALIGVLQRHASMAEGTECFGVWVMIERESNELVGDIGFHGPPDDAGTVEIGYAVIPNRRRQGYATEAASVLVAWARSLDTVGDVVAGCDPANLASVSTLERIGFQRTGIADGEIRWRYSD